MLESWLLQNIWTLKRVYFKKEVSFTTTRQDRPSLFLVASSRCQQCLNLERTGRHQPQDHFLLRRPHFPDCCHLHHPPLYHCPQIWHPPRCRLQVKIWWTMRRRWGRRWRRTPRYLESSMSSSKNISFIRKNVWPVKSESDPAWCWGPTLATSNSLATSCRPPLRFLHDFIKYLTS